MKIGIITDLHYGDDSNYPKYKGESYVNSFGTYIKAHAEEIRSRLKTYDLVVNLGDLFADKSAEVDLLTYKEAMAFLESIGRPLINAIGNHEVRNLSRDQLTAFIKQEKTYYSLDFGGLHHVVLDAIRETRDDPYLISREELDWLSEDLAATSLKTLVYIHHPLDDQSLENNYYFKDREDKALVKNRKEVRVILENSRKVLAVFSGHLHFPNTSVINDIQYITVPALTENDGTGKPMMQHVSVSWDGNEISISSEKI